MLLFFGLGQNGSHRGSKWQVLSKNKHFSLKFDDISRIILAMAKPKTAIGSQRQTQVTLITKFEVTSVVKVLGVIKRKMTVFPETVLTYNFLHYAGRKKGSIVFVSSRRIE